MEEEKEPLGEDSTSTEDTEQTASEQPPASPDVQEQCDAHKTPVVLSWEFGVPDAPAKKTSKRLFFGMFGAVLGACVLLLFLTFWLGDAGFRIVNTLQNERTIYVRDDGEIAGTLSQSEVADRVRPSTVSVVARSDTASGHGSGFVYSADGYICTNYHVIENMTVLQVVLSDGRVYDATVVGVEPHADLALLKIEASGLVPLAKGQSATLLVGETVAAMGTPAKLDFAGTATFGKVSATRRLVALTDANGSVTKKMTLIQTDAAVNPGNSGGPLVNMNGEVVGVVVMKISGNSYDGMGFAIPMDAAAPILDALMATGTFTGENLVAEGASSIGVTGHGGNGGYWYSDEPDETGKMQSSEVPQPGFHYLAQSGVYVMDVSGEQARGKLRVGDIILRINGLYAIDVRDLIGEANRHYAGETVTLTVLRGSSSYAAGEEITVTITLKERPISNE